MLIKVLLLLAIVAIAWFFLRSAPGSRGRAVRTLAVLAFAAIAALSVLFPQILTAVAHVVGVGRGTDLLLYGLVVLVLAFMASVQRRARHLEAQLTRLARRQALTDAQDQIAHASAAHQAPGASAAHPASGASADRPAGPTGSTVAEEEHS